MKIRQMFASSFSFTDSSKKSEIKLFRGARASSFMLLNSNHNWFNDPNYNTKFKRQLN